MLLQNSSPLQTSLNLTWLLPSQGPGCHLAISFPGWRQPGTEEQTTQEAVTLCKVEKESATHLLQQPAQGQEQETHSDTDACKPHTKKLLSKSGRQIPEASCNVRRCFWLPSRFPAGPPFPQTQPGELKIRPHHYSAQPFQGQKPCWYDSGHSRREH
ncbi:hypothetical protein D623_10008853 [Myotis brandtii]|uniref:Uncharacterized protein n=1 Tax=Myotis brandtii TaxID=109478 RepID=S7QFK4_MYOBR|nr:hypothetical protein D623_10008853 [Myotis brandtii]